MEELPYQYTVDGSRQASIGGISDFQSNAMSKHEC